MPRSQDASTGRVAFVEDDVADRSETRADPCVEERGDRTPAVERNAVRIGAKYAVQIVEGAEHRGLVAIAIICDRPSGSVAKANEVRGICEDEINARIGKRAQHLGAITLDDLLRVSMLVSLCMVDRGAERQSRAEKPADHRRGTGNTGAKRRELAPVDRLASAAMNRSASMHERSARLQMRQGSSLINSTIARNVKQSPGRPASLFARQLRSRPVDSNIRGAGRIPPAANVELRSNRRGASEKVGVANLLPGSAVVGALTAS